MELGIDEESFVGRYTGLGPNRGQLCLATGPDGTCVFLRGEACAVYNARPAQCAGFPVQWGASVSCPAKDGDKV
jgi:Fe-S-cluster containining protein